MDKRQWTRDKRQWTMDNGQETKDLDHALNCLWHQVHHSQLQAYKCNSGVRRAGAT